MVERNRKFSRVGMLFRRQEWGVTFQIMCVYIYGLYDFDCVYVNSLCVYVCVFWSFVGFILFYDLCVFIRFRVVCVCFDLCVYVLFVSVCVWMVCRCVLNLKQWVYVQLQEVLKLGRVQVFCLYGWCLQRMVYIWLDCV